MPVLLYRYFSSHSYATLHRAKLKTSKISAFNDTFEVLYVPIAKTITGHDIKQSLPTILKHPSYRQALEDDIKKNSYPLTIDGMEKFVAEHPEISFEDAAKEWPNIVARTELSLQRRREIIDRDQRAICFSASNATTKPQEILLWSHYATRHQGIRIGFEFPDEAGMPFQIKPMRYEELRVKVPFSLDNDDSTIKAMEDSFIVKCKIWDYENEHRLFANVKNCSREMICGSDSTAFVAEFIEFKREWVRFVDFGVYCPKSESQPIINLLNTQYPEAVARQTEMHKTDYALEYRPIQK